MTEIDAGHDEVNAEQLRSAVAESVMGWHCASRSWAYALEVECWHGDDGGAVMPCAAWRPDEDDRQNLEVLDGMIEQGFDCSVEITAGEVVVAFSRDDCGEVPVSHPQRRIALLLAALAAR